MSRRDKGERNLRIAEDIFAETLRVQVEEAIASDDTMFFLQEEWCQWPEVAMRIPERNKENLRLALDIVEKAKIYGPPSSGRIADRYIAVCRQACNLSDHNRLGPRRLLEGFLDFLKSSGNA